MVGRFEPRSGPPFPKSWPGDDVVGWAAERLSVWHIWHGSPGNVSSAQSAQVYVKQHIQEPKLHAETCRALVAKQCGKINKNHTPILSTLYCTIMYYLPDFTPCYHLGRFQEAAATPGERCTPEWSHKPNASLWSTGWILAVNYEAVRRTVRHSLIFTSLRLQGAAGRRKEETGGDGMDLDRNCVSCGKSEHHEIVVSSGFIGWYSFSTQ